MLTLLSGIQAAVTGAKIGMKIGEKIGEHLIKKKMEEAYVGDEEYTEEVIAAFNMCKNMCKTEKLSMLASYSPDSSKS